MPRCRGKCELQITHVLTNPLLADVKADPPNPPPPVNVWPTKADSTAASNAVIAAINAWAAPAPMAGCPALPPPTPGAPPVVCVCQQTGPNPDWPNMPTLQRTFAHKFASNGRNWEASITVDHKLGYVVGSCLEPPGTVFYVMGEAGIIPGHGLAVIASEEGGLTAAMLEKMGKALG